MGERVRNLAVKWICVRVHRSPARILLRLAAGVLAAAFLLPLTLTIALPAQGDGGEGTPTPAATKMSDPDSWTHPPPPGPTQADHGAFTYWMRCMVCHGDQGQGLALFRAYYPKQDQNCANHKCHGGPNPGAGFSFPDAPAILGPNTMTRFKTAAELHEFVSTRMPYQAPGTLSHDEYWNLVAYLLKQRGALPADTAIDETNASSIQVHPGGDVLVLAFLFGAVAVSLTAMVVFAFHRRGKSLRPQVR